MKINFQKINRLLLAGLMVVVFGLGFLDYTRAYFVDDAEVSNIKMTVADFSINLKGGTKRFVSENKANNMRPGDTLNATYLLENSGDISLKYSPGVEKTGGSDELCDLLDIEAKLPPKDLSFKGDLLDLTTQKPQLERGSKDSWQMKLSLSENVPDNLKEKGCQFNIIFNASQTNLDNGGFTDRVVVAEEIMVAESFESQPQSDSNQIETDNESLQDDSKGEDDKKIDENDSDKAEKKEEGDDSSPKDEEGKETKEEEEAKDSKDEEDDSKEKPSESGDLNDEDEEESEADSEDNNE